MAVEYDFVIRQGDTKPVFAATLLDQSGNAIDLTGASVQFVMRTMTGISPVVDEAATVVNASAGEVSYAFTATQTASAGGFLGTFVVTFSDTTTQTCPNDGYFELLVEENLTTAGGAQIVSLAELKDHLSIPASDKSNDAKLLRLIAQMSPVVEEICGPVLLKEVEEWHDGGQTFVELLEPPVALLTACVIWVGLTPYDMAIIEDPGHGTTYSVMLESDSPRVTRRTTGGAVTPFPVGPQAVHVWYQAGRTTVPDNITLGTLELVRIFFEQTQRGGPQLGGASSWDRDDMEPTTEILGFAVPNRVREILEPSRRGYGIW